jgi:hypothetical protein
VHDAARLGKHPRRDFISSIEAEMTWPNKANVRFVQKRQRQLGLTKEAAPNSPALDAEHLK